MYEVCFVQYGVSGSDQANCPISRELISLAAERGRFPARADALSAKGMVGANKWRPLCLEATNGSLGRSTPKIMKWIGDENNASGSGLDVRGYRATCCSVLDLTWDHRRFPTCQSATGRVTQTLLARRAGGCGVCVCVPTSVDVSEGRELVCHDGSQWLPRIYLEM